MITDPVIVDINKIREVLGPYKGLKYLISLRGFCDKKLNQPRARHKRQAAYNKGYDDLCHSKPNTGESK